MSSPTTQVFLFLQGPVSPFFARLGAALSAQGHRVIRVNLCLGDWLLWRGEGALNYRGTIQDWPDFVARLMDREGVTDLVFLGEQRPYHQAAAAAAGRRGVRVMATDYGYLRPDWLTLERDGLNGMSRFPRTAAGVTALAEAFPEPDLKQRYYTAFRQQADWDIVYNLATALGRAAYPHYRSHHVDNPLVGHLTTTWRLIKVAMGEGRRADAVIAAAQAQATPYWLFPMQMELDYSIRAYSLFDDMVRPVREVIQSFARGTAAGRLIIKLHPFDPGLRDWAKVVRETARASGVEHRVDFIDGGRLETMLDGARGVVTVNSTVGLMALQAGLPTIALGQTIYDMAGLTYQGSLDRFWAEARRPEPGLVAALVRAAAGALHVRGIFYNEPGVSAGVAGAAARLQAAEGAAVAAKIAHAVKVGAGSGQEDSPAHRLAG